MPQNPKGKFAVIAYTDGRWPSLKSVQRWSIYPIGRETPQRFYKLAEKPSRRYADDPHTDKTCALARFDTEAEAEAFVANARSSMAAKIEEQEAAEKAHVLARERLSAANHALQVATVEFASQPPADS